MSRRVSLFSDDPSAEVLEMAGSTIQIEHTAGVAVPDEWVSDVLGFTSGRTVRVEEKQERAAEKEAERKKRDEEAVQRAAQRQAEKEADREYNAKLWADREATKAEYAKVMAAQKEAERQAERLARKEEQATISYLNHALADASKAFDAAVKLSNSNPKRAELVASAEEALAAVKEAIKAFNEASADSTAAIAAIDELQVTARRLEAETTLHEDAEAKAKQLAEIADRRDFMQYLSNYERYLRDLAIVRAKNKRNKGHEEPEPMKPVNLEEYERLHPDAVNQLLAIKKAQLERQLDAKVGKAADAQTKGGKK